MTSILRNNILLLFCLFSTLILSAQNWDDYQLTKSGGEIPQEFLISSTTKYEQQKVTVANDAKRRRIQEEKFFLESNFKIDELLLSGKVIFNEPISDYLNDVADKVLKNDPVLRKKLRFYVVKSPVANAFATERGIVLVNMGLIARLESEAQLAYILCHEITHYTNNHVMESYLHKKDLQNKKSELYKDYKKSSTFDKLLVQSNYSKANEMEADKLGFERFSKTAYAYSDLAQVFDILEAADRPYDTFDFDFNTLKTIYIENLHDFIKESKTDSTIVSVAKGEVRFSLKTGIKYYTEDGDESEEDKDDKDEKEVIKRIKKKLSTHPSPVERQKIISKLIAKFSTSSKQSYLVSVERFNQVKKMTQFELCDLFLEKKAYFDAYYQALLLNNTYESSYYVKTCLAKSLYGITKYRNAKETFPKYLDYKKLKLTDQENFLNVQHLNKKKLNVLALAYSFNLYKLDSTNAHLEAICNDLIFELLDKHKIERSKQLTGEVKATFDSLKADAQFMIRYNKAKQEYDSYTEREAYFKTRKGKEELYKWQKEINRKGFSLGLKKVVVFTPLYYGIDSRKKQVKKNKSVIQYVDSEQMHLEMNEEIITASKELGLKVELLDVKAIKKTTDVARFNDVALVNAWFTETLNHDEVERFVPMTYGNILQVSKKYGTNHFVNIGVLSMTSPREHKGLILAGGLFLYPLAPYAIAKVVTPKRACYTYSVVYNVKKNRPVMAGKSEQKRKVTSGLLHNNLKTQLHQIKKKR